MADNQETEDSDSPDLFDDLLKREEEIKSTVANKIADEYIEWTERLALEYSNKIIVYKERKTAEGIKREILLTGDSDEEVITNLQKMFAEEQIDRETPLIFLSFKEDLIGS